MVIPAPPPPNELPICPGSVKVTDYELGGTEWVSIRSRFETYVWLTPDDAARLGRYLVAKYGRDQQKP